MWETGSEQYCGTAHIYTRAMGWFLPSHVDQGFIFGLLGTWHMYNTMHNYIRSPSLFKAATWFPADGRVLRHPRFRCVELWVILAIICIFILKQLSHATADMAAGVIQMQHLGRFQHVTFALFFLVYAVTGLVAEYTSILPELPAGALHCTFASGFLMELVVFHFGHHPGDDVEYFVHMLMQLILVFLVLLMFLEVQWPRSILVSVARCMMLIFKGTWFAQIGFLINYKSFVPEGCFTDDEHEYPECPTHDALMRAKSLQVLIFNWQLLCILVSTLVAYSLMVHQMRSRPSLSTPRPLLPNVLTPKGRLNVLTPRTRVREKEKEVYFQVPDEGAEEHTSGDSDGEVGEVGDVEAHGTAVKELARRISSRNARDAHAPGHE